MSNRKRMQRVIDAPQNATFEDLVHIANLDKAKDFRFRNLSGISFGKMNLTAFDFTGSDLSGSDLSKTSGFELATIQGCATRGTIFPETACITLRDQISAAFTHFLAEAPKFYTMETNLDDSGAVVDMVLRQYSTNKRRDTLKQPEALRLSPADSALAETLSKGILGLRSPYAKRELGVAHRVHGSRGVTSVLFVEQRVSNDGNYVLSRGALRAKRIQVLPSTTAETYENVEGGRTWRLRAYLPEAEHRSRIVFAISYLIEETDEAQTLSLDLTQRTIDAVFSAIA